MLLPIRIGNQRAKLPEEHVPSATKTVSRKPLPCTQFSENIFTCWARTWLEDNPPSTQPTMHHFLVQCFFIIFANQSLEPEEEVKHITHTSSLLVSHFLLAFQISTPDWFTESVNLAAIQRKTKNAPAEVTPSILIVGRCLDHQRSSEATMTAGMFSLRVF